MEVYTVQIQGMHTKANEITRQSEEEWHKEELWEKTTKSKLHFLLPFSPLGEGMKICWTERALGYYDKTFRASFTFIWDRDTDKLAFSISSTHFRSFISYNIPCPSSLISALLYSLKPLIDLYHTWCSSECFQKEVVLEDYYINAVQWYIDENVFKTTR